MPTVAGIDVGSLPKRFIFVMVCLMYEAQVVQVFVSCFVGMTELAATKPNCLHLDSEPRFSRADPG